MKENKQKIKLAILVPLGAALSGILVVSILTSYILHTQNINNETQIRHTEVTQVFEMQLDEHAQLLEGLVSFLQKDENIQDAWLAKDRAALLDYTTPIFEDICSKYDVTHFYFHGLDRVNFLRVHKPEEHSDYIDRFTMNQAVSSGKSAWGIELGTLRTFTLRFVYPWQIDGKLAGYIELGTEIEHIAAVLKKTLGVENCIILNKSYLDRSKWEEGIKMLGRESQWDQFPQFILFSNTLDRLPLAISKYLKGLLSCEEEGHFSEVLELSTNDRHYHGRFLPLIDAGGRDVGDIIVLFDITRAVAELRIFSVVLILCCVVVAGLLFGFFYFYTGKIENRLADFYNKIQAESSRRKQADKKTVSLAKFPSENPNPVLRIAKDGEVLYSNQAGELLLSKWESGIGKTVPEKWCNLVAEAFASEKGKEKEEEEEVRDKIFSLVITPVKEAGYANLYARDITEQKQLEADREIYVEREIYKEKLLKVQRYAYIGSMGALVAHQINQPLTKINILLDRAIEQIEEASCSPTALKSTKECLSEAQKAASIIRKFREYVKSSTLESSGNGNVSAIADRIVSVLSEVLRQAKMRISTNGLRDLPEVEINETALEQTFLIITQNAIEAADGRKSHKLDITGKFADGNIELQFADDCCGIAPENLDKIFEPFFSTKDNGLGLGLAIVQQIFISCGVQIRVESQLGKGTTFYVTLPISNSLKS